uniref:C-type lectin domain-containing protein n=1 Tax=Amphiprion ocellaris TaxID=80972 RepID=A0AAQ5YG03_AMPOC
GGYTIVMLLLSDPLDRTASTKLVQQLSLLAIVSDTALNCGLFSGQNVTFVYINIPMTWTEAQSYCRAHHTDLASVRNMTENQKVTHWIGLHVEKWTWSLADEMFYSDGEAEFRNWYNGEPNNFAQNEYCTAMWYSEKWNDYPCESTIPSVCSDVRETCALFLYLT